MADKLAVKIAKAALDVGGKLSPDKRNKEQGYDYISADKILSMCGQALSSQGVAVIPTVTEKAVNIYEYANGTKRRYDASVSITFYITDGETDTTALWFGAGSDYTVPDKALYKAITSGHKYFLMKLLCVGAGNEDGEHEDEPQPRQQAQRRNGGQPIPPPDDFPDIPDEPAHQTPPPAQTNSLRPYPPETVKDRMTRYAAEMTKQGKHPNGDRVMIVPNLEKLFGGDNASEKRHTVTRYLFGKGSSKDLTDGELLALKKWMGYQPTDEGEWLPDPMAIKEANALYAAALEAEGQGQLL